MSDEATMDDVIENSQDDMGGNDFLSFDEAIESLDEGETKEDKTDDNVNENDDEPDGENESDKEKPAEEPEKEDKSESKKIFAQDGDSKVEISPESKIMVPIDGKNVEMTMQDIINKASGVTAVDKRFSDLANQSNVHKADVNQFNNEKDDLLSKVSSFTDAVNKGDGLKAVDSLAVLTGHNPVELRAHFKDLLIKDVKAYLDMSPESQKEFDIQQERAYYKQERDMRDNQESNQQSNIELENSLLRFQAKNGINDADLVALYDKAEAKSLDIQSAEDLERFYSIELTQNRSSDLISEVDPSLKNDEEALGIVSDFITQNPEMKDEEVIESIKIAMGIDEEAPKTEKKGKSLSDKIKSKQQKNLKGKQTVDTQEFDESDDEDDVLVFGDMEF